MLISENPDPELLRKLKIETLAWVKVQRAAVGLSNIAELPKGVPGDLYSCTVAEAFKNGWEVQTSYTTTTLTKRRRFRRDKVVRRFEHPQDVSQFIRLFDNGRYPELVEE